MSKSVDNLVWHEATITKADRQAKNNHKSCLLWFTGLSGSGKSTLANALDQVLYNNHLNSYVLDGDNIRQGLNQDLGFTDADRVENIRRIGEVSKLFVDAGTIVSTAFISPFENDRQRVRERFAENEFIEVYVKCDLEECEKRDVKGLYKKARAGEIPYFTGISSPYEAPSQPEIIVDTANETIEQSVEKLVNYLKGKQIVR
ncbi:adenylyl-sulfate kinase [Shouchella lehensis]|uniref:Adenylyl-sulfate kinase n=2 Tax=Shouchella lehensis TaxID=300825 RepID=A0A060LYP0_9BACI|nr:adenylyl-sulfate kinase [Shouchella lehensis]AIC93403.1 adenylylsulfate kinase [Shouchella lehensis G1]MBG9782857.1 adenylylsulfate kinase [Shouchella lehensis]RQW22963.1 adenylyl-sulfate kinase [Bacillus sp. C1-1]TES49797.1 adenylyl-sulfate kinase [Shouchella lehensis]